MVSIACALIFEPVFTQGVESEVDVATALTRARQARLPSPWMDRERDLEGRERENHLISIFLAFSQHLARRRVRRRAPVPRRFCLGRGRPLARSRDARRPSR